jgi:REP element-mobilizing transposase RayT
MDTVSTAMHVTHVYSDLWFHLNWHCKDDLPLITTETEPVLYGFVEDYCRRVKGVFYEAMGGTETHIHLVFRAEPFVDLSEFIGKLKGSSAHFLNKRFHRDAMRWQRGYGLVTFAYRNLPAMCAYVRKQKEHHRARTANAVLEKCWTAGEEPEADRMSAGEDDCMSE